MTRFLFALGAATLALSPTAAVAGAGSDAHGTHHGQHCDH
jgi:hypothetical protein